MPPLFTIVTATRDRPDLLAAALDSVLAQECGDFEHLIVDDASEGPGTRDVVATRGDARVRVLALPESRGPAGARNAALAQAQGRYIAVLDDDDVMLPARLERSAAHLEQDTARVLVAGAFDAIDEAGQVQAVVRPPTDEALLREILPHHNPFCHSTCAIRADTLRALGGYREPLRYSHDYDMVLRVAERGGIAILPERLGQYRFYAGNISTSRCFLQGAYARLAQDCALRRAAGTAEELAPRAQAIAQQPQTVSERRATGRALYQIGEWKFRDGRTREARPYLRAAWRAEPLRPLCAALATAAHLPRWLRRAIGPLFRRIAAARYPSWKSHPAADPDGE